MIRQATAADIDELCDIAAFYVPTLPFENITFSAPTFREYLARLIAAQEQGADTVALVKVADGAIVAAITMAVCVVPLTGLRTAIKLNWGALPSHAGAGIAVLHAAEKWARERKASRFVASVFGNRAERVMRAKGFAPTETTFEKVL